MSYRIQDNDFNNLCSEAIFIDDIPVFISMLVPNIKLVYVVFINDMKLIKFNCVNTFWLAETSFQLFFTDSHQLF